MRCRRRSGTGTLTVTCSLSSRRSLFHQASSVALSHGSIDDQSKSEQVHGDTNRPFEGFQD